MTESARSLSRVRKIAKHLKRAAREKGEELKHSKALDLAAQQCGYSNFRHASKVLPENDPTPDKTE